VAATPAPSKSKETQSAAATPSKKSNAPKEAKQKKTKEVASSSSNAAQPASFKPMQAPDLGISNDKQQRLSDLLQKYRADQITPEEYQQQRAKILAQP
jgi:hypothetical protein